MAGVDIIDWLILDLKNTLEFIMERMNLYGGKLILTDLKASGGMQKLGLLSLGELEKSRIITT